VLNQLERDEFYLQLAEQISRASKCSKGNFGAVIVKDDMVIGLGYNGPARGVDHCNPCRRADCDPGSGYDKCIAAHAEVNAIIQAGGRERCLGSTLYMDSHNRKPGCGGVYNTQLGFFPCDNCFKYIVNAGIDCVVHRGPDVAIKVVNIDDAINTFNAGLRGSRW
jgi:dCMP deaminase